MSVPGTPGDVFPSVGDDDKRKERPRKGRLEVLPTKAQTEARFKPVQAFITTISARSANSALKAVDNALRGSQSVHAQPLQHLRRFVRPENLPGHLKDQLTTAPTSHKDETLERGKGKERENFDDQVEATSSGRSPLFLLICATVDLTLEDVRSLLNLVDAFNRVDTEPPISIITVPGLPPSSEAQARQWSQEYWPTVYKKHNPFGAQPAIVALAVTQMEEKVDEYMELARKVGKDALKACIGEDIGVVAVERRETGRPAITMVAGDARWNLSGRCSAREGGNGNAMAHAVMRVIGLIAKKRQDALTDSPSTRDVDSDAFTDVPLTLLEKEVYAKSNIEPGGYLCLDLEFYLTHEPCVMCSMALLHSRVGRVIFEKRMPFTGGLHAGGTEDEAGNAPGLEYGLFWRPSLNWKFLTWQWRPEDDPSPSDSFNEKLHA